MKPVLLSPIGALPPADHIAESLRAAWPGAAVDATRTWYGPRVRAEVVLDGVALSIDLHHAQGQRRPVAVMTLRASCATRGLALRVLPARSIPRSWTPLPLPRASLRALGAVVAPAAAAPVLLDAVSLDALAAAGENLHAEPTLTVENDAVELSLMGWPGDVATAAHLAALVVRITRAVSPALAAHGGDLRAHPEVLALAAWDARRRRIAHGLLLAVAVVTLLVSLVSVMAMTPTG
jgi:hypothetical protein